MVMQLLQKDIYLLHSSRTLSGNLEIAMSSLFTLYEKSISGPRGPSYVHIAAGYW